jgi:hypothetical protein
LNIINNDCYKDDYNIFEEEKGKWKRNILEIDSRLESFEIERKNKNIFLIYNSRMNQE